MLSTRNLDKYKLFMYKPENTMQKHDDFLSFIDSIEKASGDRTLCEAVRNGYKVCMEGVEAPGLMAFGRGYGEDSSFNSDATTMFNRMATLNDPFSGTSNPILQRLSDFENNRQYKFTVDDEPELDAYDKTIFINDDDMGDGAYSVNGNPYKILDTIEKPGTAAGYKKAEPVEEPGIDDSFLRQFETAFKS